MDHEGGWVLRFKRGVTPMPGNAALGRAGDPVLAYEPGRHMALELAALGIRLNLAPVLDVAVSSYNPGIGMRSFGPDARKVGELGASFVRGLEDHGVFACAKHFPGKGAARVDAHAQRPTITLSGKELSAVHLVPFRRAIATGVSCVMTSHVRYPALDKTAAATFSPRSSRGFCAAVWGFAASWSRTTYAWER